MRRYFLILLFLSGCSQGSFDSGSRTLQATCYMKDFKGFPEKVTGPVTLELKNFLTILIENKDGSESVEMTFPKSKCKVK